MEVAQKLTEKSSAEKVEIVNKEGTMEKEEENNDRLNSTNNFNGSEGFSITDQIEKRKVDKMRAFCQIQDPSSQEMDDYTFRRFLRARDQDIDKASHMFLKYQIWRRLFVPEGSVSESEIPNEIAQNKFFMQGLDKKGRPIAVLFAARHKQAHFDEFKRCVVYCLDKICSRMPRGHEKFIAIGDLEGWGYSNCDIRGYLAALTLLQDYYPERIAKVFIVHAPYIFMAAWKMIYPFIDNNTKMKIVFVENQNLKSTLLSEIDETQLPVQYGGKLPLKPIQHC